MASTNSDDTTKSLFLVSLACSFLHFKPPSPPYKNLDDFANSSYPCGCWRLNVEATSVAALLSAIALTAVGSRSGVGLRAVSGRGSRAGSHSGGRNDGRGRGGGHSGDRDGGAGSHERGSVGGDGWDDRSRGGRGGGGSDGTAAGLAALKLAGQEGSDPLEDLLESQAVMARRGGAGAAVTGWNGGGWKDRGDGRGNSTSRESSGEVGNDGRHNSWEISTDWGDDRGQSLSGKSGGQVSKDGRGSGRDDAAGWVGSAEGSGAVASWEWGTWALQGDGGSAAAGAGGLNGGNDAGDAGANGEGGSLDNSAASWAVGHIGSAASDGNDTSGINGDGDWDGWGGRDRSRADRGNDRGSWGAGRASDCGGLRAGTNGAAVAGWDNDNRRGDRRGDGGGAGDVGGDHGWGGQHGGRARGGQSMADWASPVSLVSRLLPL